MPIKQKALILILSVTAISFISVNLIISFFITTNLGRIEDGHAVSDINTVKYLLDSRTRDLEVKVKDYAVWDDSYNFVNEQNEVYIKNNINLQVFENFGINYFAFFKNDGSFVYGKYLPQGGQEFQEIGDADREALGSVFAKATNGVVSGYININKNMLMVAAHSVFETGGNGASRGYLLFAKEFNFSDVKELSNLTNFNIDIVPLNTLDHSIKDKLTDAHYRKTDIITYKGNTLEIQGVKGDIFSNPSLVVTLRIYRDIYTKSLQLLLTIWIVYFVLSAITVAIWLIYSDKLIFKRLKSLSIQVSNLKHDKGFLHSKLTVDGNDEISSLAVHINELLAALKISQDNFQRANESLKNKAVEFENKTNELEKMNQFMIGREVRMSELKKQIQELEEKLKIQNVQG